MPGAKRFDPYLPIDEIMRRWPQTIPVLIGRRMLCVGCALAPFHNAIDAAIEHDIDEDAFLADLRRVLDEDTA